MQEYYEFVQKGFRILHPLMAGYIGREMNKNYHNDWWSEVLYALNDQRDLPVAGTYEELIDSLDIANCLRLIDRKWNEVFKNELDMNCRTWAKELMGVRNVVAHIGQQDLSQSDAERALDTMSRICKSFDEDGAKDIMEVYLEVRNSNHENISETTGPKPIDIPYQGTTRGQLSNGKVQNLISLIGTDVVQKTTLTRKVSFAGKTEAYPVYKVKLDALYYNDQNDRIATWISRYRSENGGDALSRLDGEEYNNIIENFIFESNPESIQKTQRNIALIGQREPGVTLSDGRIVDGNRRYTCLRRLQRSKSEDIYFETVIMDVDIQKDKKQIKLLELAIQHGEEKKVDYDLIDYAIGTYMDVVRTKLLTIEEYASSTNESVADVKKRIDIAEIICEFLEYIRLPEQYHIAREYQVYSLFQEMLAPLKQLSGDERKQLKTIVFNNVLMKALLDQRKFIRDLKLLIKNDTYTMYFDDQAEINMMLHEKYDVCDIRNRNDIEKFAQENDDLGEELQLSLQKALLRSRKQQLKAKPAENVAKSVSLMTEFDARMFDKMDAGEKKSLQKEMSQLSAVVDSYNAMLNGDGAKVDGSGRLVRREAVDYTLETSVPKVENEKKQFSLEIINVNNPLVVCSDLFKEITTLSFSLKFTAIKESPRQNDSISVELFFTDEKMNEVSEKIKQQIFVGEDKKINFVLNGATSEKKKIYLVVRTDNCNENVAQRVIPFDVNISFSADFDI